MGRALLLPGEKSIVLGRTDARYIARKHIYTTHGVTRNKLQLTRGPHLAKGYTYHVETESIRWK